MPKYSGALRPFNAGEQRRDVRSFVSRADDGFRTAEGGIFLCIITIFVNILSWLIPIGSLLFYAPIGWFLKRYTYPKKMVHEMPLRMPAHADLPDGSFDAGKFDIDLRKNPEKAKGQGVSYLGLCRETGRQVWLTNSDDRTHMMVLGTTGSGKTEFIFCLLINQFVQNSGFIFVDAKGDINGQRQVVRMARRFGRQDDVLTISFATSGRDLMQPQTDKLTNTFNIMSSTSAPMLIELLSGMLDDSGGGGGDMWQGRAMAYIAAITRPLTYLRDRGYIQLSPACYIQYMELSEVEKLLFKHDGIYGAKFDEVLQPLRAYIISLPGYDRSRIDKGQEQKTNEQFGFITMQLTRVINDLSYNYGHIFGTDSGGDIDIFDVVVNRRIMTVLLPSMERSPATLKMLGKLIVGSIKQMMAGSLGNRMEGLTRMTVDSRPTSATNAFKIVLDEWGYIVVVGASVMPAQARGLGISMVFAAQSYTDIMRGSKEEAEATWDNTTVKVCGRLTSGDDSETFRKIQGAAGKEVQISNAHYDVKPGFGGAIRYKQGKTLNKELKERVTIDDLSQQEQGEFTVIMARKFKGGNEGGIAVVRMLAFYTSGGGESPRMYLNDLVASILPDKENYKHLAENRELVKKHLAKGTFSENIERLVRGERLRESDSSKSSYFNVINMLFHTQEIFASQAKEDVKLDLTSIIASQVHQAIKQSNFNENTLEDLLDRDREDQPKLILTTADDILKPEAIYEDYDYDDAYNERQLGEASLSHLATVMTSQINDDSSLNNKAIGYVRDDNNYDLKKRIEGDDSLVFSQFVDTSSKSIFALYNVLSSNHQFMTPEQKQAARQNRQQDYYNTLSGIEHGQISYCDKAIMSKANYKGEYSEDLEAEVTPVRDLVNSFSRNYSVTLFELLSEDTGLIYDKNTNLADTDENILYQNIVSNISSSVAVRKSLFDLLTYDYPQKPIDTFSDLVGDDWQKRLTELKDLGINNKKQLNTD